MYFDEENNMEIEDTEWWKISNVTRPEGAHDNPALDFVTWPRAARSPWTPT